tara:strand:+ start:232 stop:984 length:753 start_codon:yes stop_codon:yes gene_type:complete
MDFKNNKTIIIGASRSIGSKIAEKFAIEGSDLILIARNKELLNLIKKNLVKYNVEVEIIKSDFSKEKNRKILSDKLNTKKFNFNNLINVAGTQFSSTINNSKYDDWLNTFEINFFSYVDFIPKIINKFEKNSSIVNISSISSLLSSASLGVYGSSKAALNHFTKTSAVEYSKKLIRVNSILPGLVETENLQNMFKYYSKDKKIELEKKHLLGFGKTDDIANATSFLCSSKAQWITGTTLIVDGGFSLNNI